jgi:Putative MetA-pathway of phenol degradation
MDRKNPKFVFRVAVVMLLCALSHDMAAAAQSSTPQPSPATQTKDSDDEDLINPDRPGLADGSSVVGAGRLQIEGGIQSEFRRRQVTREHTLFFPIELRIGISGRWEARIESNTFTRTIDFDVIDVTNRDSGLAPLSFGFKYHIQDSGGVRHPALGAIVRIFPTWGTSDLRTHHVTGDLRLVADWDVAPKLSLNPNVGVGVYEDDQGREFAAGLFAMTLNYLPSKKLNPFIDIGLQAPEEKKGQSSIIVDAGLAYIVGSNWQLDVSAGAGAHGETPPHPFISFGVSWRLNTIRHRK